MEVSRGKDNIALMKAHMGTLCSVHAVINKIPALESSSGKHFSDTPNTGSLFLINRKWKSQRMMPRLKRGKTRKMRSLTSPDIDLCTAYG